MTNFPDGMTSRDWKHVYGERLEEYPETDWNCLQCDAVMYNGELDVLGDPACDHSDRQLMCGPCGIPKNEDYGCLRCGE